MNINVINIRGAREAPKAERSRMETLLLTPDIVVEWRIPPFQRPLRVNKKVLQIAAELRSNGGIIKGVISLGTVGSTKVYYLYDGQHRMEAAKISGLPEFIADVRINHFDTLAEMAEEYVELNTQIARLKPDDVLRGLEGSLPVLRTIRTKCPFVGYDNVRRGGTSPLLSMASTVRCWMSTKGETPAFNSAGGSATVIAQSMAPDDAEGLVEFLTVAHTAWRNDPENYRLWSNLNFSMCAWLWRQLVKDSGSSLSRSSRLTVDEFKNCLMTVAATRDYLDWLVGRLFRDLDRAPCYARLKSIFIGRLRHDGAVSPKLPSPPWSTSRAGGA